MLNRFGMWSIIFLIALVISIICIVKFNGWWIVFPVACAWSFSKLGDRP